MEHDLKMRGLFSMFACTLLIGCPCSADTVVPVSVAIQSNSVMEVKRRYIAASEKPPNRRIIFSAKKLITMDERVVWYLDVIAEDQQLKAHNEEEIVGEKGLLFQCLDRLKVEEPEAFGERVDEIELDLDLRVSNAIWVGIVKDLMPLLTKWEGAVSGAEQDKRNQILTTIGHYVSSSSDAHNIAVAVAGRFKCTPPTSVTISCEALNFDPEIYGKLWNQLPNCPHLGIKMKSIFMSIRLKPKRRGS